MRGNISCLIFFAFFLLSLVACNINRFYVEDSITLRVKESLYIDNSCVLCPVFVHENIDGANSANLLKNELKLKYEETKLDDFTLVSSFLDKQAQSILSKRDLYSSFYSNTIYIITFIYRFGKIDEMRIYDIIDASYHVVFGDSV